MDLVKKHPAKMHPPADYPPPDGSKVTDGSDGEEDVIVLGVHIRGTDKDPRIAGG